MKAIEFERNQIKAITKEVQLLEKNNLQDLAFRL
jgi:hypothetical protein